MPKAKLESLNTRLNIVLDKESINTIVRGVIGRNGGKLIGPGGVAINDDHCCVDASVGSSAIGPFSSVGSSVSHSPFVTRGRVAVGRPMRKTKTRVQGKVSRGGATSVKVKVPKSVKVR